MNVWIVFPRGGQQIGFYQGWFPQLAILSSRPRVKVGSKSSRHHQGAPKDSNCLHNRLKSLAGREERPLGGNLGPPWALVETPPICAKCLHSLGIEGAIAMIWQSSLFYKGLYWDLEKLRNMFQAPMVGCGITGTCTGMRTEMSRFFLQNLFNSPMLCPHNEDAAREV